MTVQVTAKRRRREARQDERYSKRRLGDVVAEARARRRRFEAEKAAKKGRSFGFSKK